MKNNSSDPYNIHKTHLKAYFEACKNIFIIFFVYIYKNGK